MFAKMGKADLFPQALSLKEATKRRWAVMKLPIQSARITGRTEQGWKDGAVTERWTGQREKLLELRAAVSERVRQLSGEACEETPNYSMHMADAATDSFDRDLTLGLASFEQEALYEIDAALKRIEDGTYGICELTGQPIPWDRLVAIPWARCTVGAEKVIESHVHPHIGELATIRPEVELAEKEST